MDGDVFTADCAARRALDLVSDKWAILAVYALADGPRRHMELRRQLGGVTQKMLTQTLRRLELSGVVTRAEHGTVPPAVEYALSPLGETLLGPLGALCGWAEEHMHEVAMTAS
jgi:DNA-binding HxlR family transcriptional regulator